jgi:hypothetical protein
MVERLAHKVMLVVACCFVLVLLPISTAAGQDILDKTKEGVQKGAEGVKEGAEEVGEETKDVFTDDDPDTDKDEGIERDATSSERMKAGEAQEKKSTTTSETKSSEATRTTTESSEESDASGLPATAGGLPILALTGVLALLSAGALRVRRRRL